MIHARAILWAQWRTSRNFYPRGGMALTAIVAFTWYGLWCAGAVLAARLLADPSAAPRLSTFLPSALLLVLLYWQVVPLLMAATGASLDIRKLRAYPIPVHQLFGIEVLLRVTAGIEMLLVMLGAAVGVILNPALPAWGALGLAAFAAFNLVIAVGLRDLAVRILAYRRVRELFVLVLVLAAGLPQLMLGLGRRNAGPGGGVAFFRGTFGSAFSAGESWAGWPWSAASAFIEARHALLQAAILLGWCAAAAAFGWWQFNSSLRFDAEAAGARLGHSSERTNLLDRLYRLPAALFRDPLAALMEKEIRLLSRSPRFRLVFMMGFTFGMVVWLPMAMGRRGSQSFLGTHYLTAVSVYSLLLLSEVCFWNSFGFDRSAAQFYFLAPIPFSRVLTAKNLSSVFFIALEIALITLVCALLGMPLDPSKMLEAYSVAAVMTILLLCAGNLLSVRMARGVNPDSSFRTAAAGRIQAMLFMIYPLAFIPPALAYLARYAFDSQWAFFGVLAFDAAAGLVAYKIAVESASEAAERTKETMLTALAQGDGPIAG